MELKYDCAKDFNIAIFYFRSVKVNFNKRMVMIMHFNSMRSVFRGAETLESHVKGENV